jgi:hypothetical protein
VEVADVVVVGVELLELLELEVVGEEVVDELVVLELVVLELLVVAVVLLQSCEASCASVLTPCPRLACSVGLTDAGRFATELPTALTALLAAAQLPEARADETRSSPLLSVAA